MMIEKLEKPYFWEKYDILITHDGYHECGLRVMLTDSVMVATILDNALVCQNNLSVRAIFEWVEFFNEKRGK